MPKKRLKIGIVAPGRALEKAAAARVEQTAESFSEDLELLFHPQCFLQHGHFAGDDRARSAAFFEYANDPAIDVIWFALGGYGACRLEDSIFENLSDHARRKIYLGYSDTGTILARLQVLGFPKLAHGPMPGDIKRKSGENAIRRALQFLSSDDSAMIEQSVGLNEKHAAFNITVLSHLIGTPWQPDLEGHILHLEDVGEYLYRIDRALFTILSNENVRSCAGIRLGRCSQIPENDIEFGGTEVDSINYWCTRYNIPYLGRSDIGHDTENKIIPFRGQ